jgi:signal transduction histidine kinase
VVDAEPGLEIDADPERMQQLLDGLFDNAIRHGAGPIGLGAHRRDGSAEISVHDHGKGFPTWFLPQAFERLSRADTARGRGGGGLGLSIVRLIAEAHGGSAGAYNDDGAFVSVLLPLAHPPAGRAGVTGRDTGGKTSTLSLPEN